MRREHGIATTVYQHLFPTPSSNDPPDFATHLAKHLVAEVRIETQRFYGGLETVEARYPGLNYSHAPHRKRLGRFPHHARLFRAFDDLGLTEHEIGMLCRWEGTLWARQRYERDEGIKVVDTTCVEIGPWVDRRRVQKRGRRSSPRGIKVKTDIEVEIEEVGSSSGARTRTATPVPPTSFSQPRTQIVEMADAVPSQQTEDSDEELESAGIELNPRLMAAAAAREMPSRSNDIVLDPAWEQYLKEQAERGEIAFTGDLSSSLRAAALASALQNGGPALAPSSSIQQQPPSTVVQQ